MTDTASRFTVPAPAEATSSNAASGAPAPPTVRVAVNCFQPRALADTSNSAVPSCAPERGSTRQAVSDVTPVAVAKKETVKLEPGAALMPQKPGLRTPSPTACAGQERGAQRVVHNKGDSGE